MKHTTIKQVTIDEDRVICDCGYYDKSLAPVTLARIHNTSAHMGNYAIYDLKHGLRSQLTGNVLAHDRNQRSRE